MNKEFITLDEETYFNQLQEAIELLKESLEVLSDFNSEPEDKVRTFLNQFK